MTLIFWSVAVAPTFHVTLTDVRLTSEEHRMIRLIQYIDSKNQRHVGIVDTANGENIQRIDGVSSGGYRRGGGEWLRRACGDDSDVEI